MQRIENLFKWIGAAALTCMMLLTVADVVGRLFKHPIFGSVEIVGFMAVVVTAAALPYTERNNGHVGVEILMRLLSPRTRLKIDIITRCLSLVLFSAISWQMILYAGDLKTAGEVSMNLEFPLFLVVYALAASLFVFALSLLGGIVDMVTSLRKLDPK